MGRPITADTNEDFPTMSNTPLPRNPKIRTLPSYVQKRKKRYYAILEIPKALRQHYPGKSPGKSLVRLVQSLETDSLVVAGRRAAAVVAAWKGDFARLRNEHDDAAYFSRRLRTATTEGEKQTVMAAIELEAGNIASPTYTLDRNHEITPEDMREQEEMVQQEAKDFVDRATGEVVGFTDRLEEWLARSTVTEKTKSMQESDVRRFGVAFPTVQDVTHEGVQRWVDGLGLSPKTIKRILGPLRGYWKYLQRSDVKAAKKDFMPFTNLDLPKRANGPKDQRRPFGKGEVMSLLLLASRKDEQLKDLIMLAMWTGCRIEELCSLKVDKVYEKAPIPYVEIEDAKTAAGWRQVPIHTSLQQHVEALKGESEDGYLMSGLSPNKYGDRSNAIGKRFGRLKTARGFGPEYVFHSIRKTCATLLEQAGVAENIAADILGHEKNTMSYGLYSGGSSMDQKAKAIEKLNYGKAS